MTKLRDDAQKNAESYEALTKRLHEVSTERNDLSEKLRHGLSVQEKDEYAKEIQTLVKVKKEFTHKFGEMSDTIERQQSQILMLESEVDRLKKVGRGDSWQWHHRSFILGGGSAEERVESFCRVRCFGGGRNSGR